MVAMFWWRCTGDVATTVTMTQCRSPLSQRQQDDRVPITPVNNPAAFGLLAMVMAMYGGTAPCFDTDGMALQLRNPDTESPIYLGRYVPDTISSILIQDKIKAKAKRN